MLGGLKPAAYGGMHEWSTGSLDPALILALLLLTSSSLSLAACGRKGPPLPPLRPVPAAVSEFSAERNGMTVTLRFTIPTANQDGSTPPAVERVEVYGVTQPVSSPAPAPEEILQTSHLVSTTNVARPGDRPPPAGTTPRPAPGAQVSHVETLQPASTPADESLVRYYLAQPVAGRRRGPASRVLAVPLSSMPESASDLRTDYTEETLSIVWGAQGPSSRFVVEQAKGEDYTVLTPEPLASPAFSTKVEFGIERCFVVRTLDVRESVTIVGIRSAPICVTPVDRFPPAPPSGLEAVAGEGGIDLAWTASASADVAGYVVLRGEGSSGTLQRLTPAPIAATDYRDSNVRAGETYVYAVIAVDAATPPNESQPSNRRVVTR